MSISWTLILPSLKKSLIVEQFQGNYLKKERKESLPNHLSVLALFYDIEEEGKSFIKVNKFRLKLQPSSNRYR